MQRDAFQEIGETNPDIEGRVKQQMAGVPGLHLFAELGSAKKLIGVGGHLRTIRPADSVDVFTSTVLTAYGKLIGSGLAIRGKLIYGGDMADQLMLGGYAAVTDATNSTTEYKPLNNLSAWLDVMTAGKTISVGIFAGYSTNLGLSSDISGTDTYSLAYARSPNIADLWRVSPRAVYNAGKLRFAFELEITSALYAGDYEQNLAPKELSVDERVTNIRGLFATYLFF